jgi:hypothetical protein
LETNGKADTADKQPEKFSTENQNNGADEYVDKNNCLTTSN